MKKPLVILGSSHSNGATRKLVDLIFQKIPHTLEDLNKYQIGYYTYDYRHKKDDFMPLIEEMMAYDQWIFATPVYWYSMSAVMKTFFDRITDVLKLREDLRKRFAEKTLYLISCSDDNDLPDGFVMPFKNTAGYLDMKFGGSMHGWQKDQVYSPEAMAVIEDFRKTII